MSHKWYVALCLACLQIPCTINISAQVVSGIDSIVKPDPAKGQVRIISLIDGSLFLNNDYLTKLTGGDTTYILNLTPGIYKSRITSDSLLIEQQLLVEAGKGTQIIIDSNTWNVREYRITFNKAEDSFKKARFQIKKGKFYNVTQISLLSFHLGVYDTYFDSSEPVVRMFNSPTMINGYQFAPGFCMGMGLMYNNYDIALFDGYEASDEIENVSFMPIYADIRAHFPQRGRNVAFFFKFDIGYNIVLTKKTGFYSNIDPYNGITYSYLRQVTDGGIMVSPGLGFRILISDLIQIIPSIEYSFARSQILVKNFTDGQLTYMDTYDNNFDCFRITIGIAFQY